MTTASQPCPGMVREADRPLERVLDDRDMRRFMPPRAPLPMPEQDLTPRFNLQRVLSVIGLTMASR